MTLSLKFAETLTTMINAFLMLMVSGDIHKHQIPQVTPTFHIGIGQMHRGCASDYTNDRNECTAVGQKCVLCDETGCNTAPAISRSALSCIQCLNINEGCAWGHAMSRSAGCAPDVIFPSVESCYTYIYDDGTVTRGCTLDNQSLCNEDDERCRRCGGNGCNAQNVITQSCKVCRSDTSGQERCGEETVDGFDQSCGSIVEYENRGCYSKKEGRQGNVFC